MGQYIQPASAVVEQGIKVDSPPTTWNDLKDRLRDGESLAAVANRSHGMVALLVSGSADYDHARSVGGDFYIIDADLARKAA